MLRASGASGATSSKAEVIENMSKEELDFFPPPILPYSYTSPTLGKDWSGDSFLRE